MGNSITHLTLSSTNDDEIDQQKSEDMIYPVTEENIGEYGTENKNNVGEKSKLFPCLQCEKSFWTKGDMVRHISSIHEDKKPHKCDFCDYKAKRKDNLKSHIANVHGLELKKVDSDNSTEVKNEPIFHQESTEPSISADYLEDDCMDPQASLNSETYPCVKCYATFTSRKDLLKHIRKTKHFPPLPSEEVKNEQFLQESSEDPSKSADNLDTSMDPLVSFNLKPGTAYVPIEIGNFTCTDCGSIFTHKSTMEQHFKSVHLKLKPFVCPKCGKECSKRNNLKRHIESVHQKLRPYSCDQCQASFSERSILREHVGQVHEGLRFPCSLCDVTFGSKRNLLRHIRKTHKNE